MLELILSPSQVEIAIGTSTPLPVRDSQGKFLGYFNPVVRNSAFTEADVEAVKAALRAPGPRKTTAEVLEHLKSLEQR